jgi:hypothetical protein
MPWVLLYPRVQRQAKEMDNLDLASSKLKGYRCPCYRHPSFGQKLKTGYAKEA